MAELFVGGRGPNRARQVVRAQLSAWNTTRSSTELMDASRPERLIGEVRHEDRRASGSQTGCRRPRSTVMHESGHTREQPLVRKRLNGEHVIGEGGWGWPKHVGCDDAALSGLGQSVHAHPRDLVRLPPAP